MTNLFTLAQNIALEGVDIAYDMDLCDAQIVSAEMPDGTPFTSDQIAVLNSDACFVYETALAVALDL